VYTVPGSAWGTRKGPRPSAVGAFPVVQEFCWPRGWEPGPGDPQGGRDWRSFQTKEFSEICSAMPNSLSRSREDTKRDSGGDGGHVERRMGDFNLHDVDVDGVLAQAKP
jgi:hypothetical protein